MGLAQTKFVERPAAPACTHLKSFVKNSRVKRNMDSFPDFEDKFKLAVKQEKMTSDRMEELLVHIKPILLNRVDYGD